MQARGNGGRGRTHIKLGVVPASRRHVLDAAIEALDDLLVRRRGELVEACVKILRLGHLSSVVVGAARDGEGGQKLLVAVFRSGEIGEWRKVTSPRSLPEEMRKERVRQG